MRTRITTTLVPALLMVYAVARWVDGRDDTYGPGLAWNVGHLAFLGAFAGFGLLTADFWQRSPRRHAGVALATAASMVGVLLFCWVIVTDLSPALDERASLPDPVMMVGPLVFIVGFVAALALHCRQTCVARWGLPPAAALTALVLVGASLDLLPLTAVLMGAALWPVGASRNR